MSYAKFQGNIVERPLVQKIKDVILVPKKKRIVKVWEKNIVLPVQSRRGNVPIAKNYLLNALLMVISF